MREAEGKSHKQSEESVCREQTREMECIEDESQLCALVCLSCTLMRPERGHTRARAHAHSLNPHLQIPLDEPQISRLCCLAHWGVNEQIRACLWISPLNHSIHSLIHSFSSDRLKSTTETPYRKWVKKQQYCPRRPRWDIEIEIYRYS